MDIIGVIVEISKDADQAAAGHQAQPLYVALTVVLPLAIGVGVATTLTAIERLLRLHGGHH